VLSDAGYGVSTDYRDGMKTVLATTQGHIGDVLPDKIVYDAQTTSGGSGGPLFNNEGKVIGINFAMVREFGGSNFAIPVGYGKSLLKH
jgi:serine protease Do